MKKLILVGLFLVTWNKNILSPHTDGVPYAESKGGDLIWHPDGKFLYYSIEVDTDSVTLATQKDVDLFVGGDVPAPFSGDYNPPLMKHIDGIIPDGAFNVKVKEIK